ncbi:MAG: invasion associated locus B family protein [Alphaproteobacteria bacterium]
MMALPAVAQDVTTIGTRGDWTAYSFKEGKGKVCYAASLPARSEGNYAKRGDVFALVTHRPAEKSFGVVSIVAGYSYKPDSPVEMAIGDKMFKLISHGETAWASGSDDKAIVAAMKNGNSMQVRGKSARNTETTDMFSLKGFSAALDTIDKACGTR